LTDHTDSHCYALRNLSPFTGVVQVIELPEGRAFSVDGINWDIQVLAETINSCWSVPTDNNVRKQFYHYATWSKEEGLSNPIINPVLDIGAMKTGGEAVLQAVKNQSHGVPFELVDRYEYWLLDKNGGLPLALLKAQQGEPTDGSLTSKWIATPQQQRTFPSCAYDGEGPELTSSDHLEQQVNQHSGHQYPARWFYRENDGSGVAVTERIDSSPIPQKLSAIDFPELLLQEQWIDNNQQQLARDYLAWLSPHMLTLQHISDATRERLETAAMKRPETTATLYHLIPKIISKDKLTSIRIQAKLIRSN